MRKVKFKSLELKNFKCHSELGVDFSTNRLVAITGPNGSGKSSIFDAICWCLYDITPRGRKADSVVRKRDGKNTSVVLTFDIDDDQYEIRNYRKHKEFGDSKHLFKNGENISGATTKDTNLVIKNLVLPYSIFTNCIMFSKFIDKSFTQLTYSGKADIIEQILNTGQYEEYRKKFVAQLTVIDENVTKIETELTKVRTLESVSKDKLKEIETQFTMLTDQYEKNVYEMNSNIASLSASILINQKRLNPEESIDHLSEIKNNSTTKISNYNIELSNLDNLMKQQIGGIEENLKLNTSIFIKDMTADKQKHLSAEQDKLNNLSIEISQLKNQKDIYLSNQRNALTNSISNTSQKYDIMINQKDIELNNIKSELNNILITGKDLRKTQTTKSQEIDAVKLKLQDEIPICYMCGQKIVDEGAMCTMRSNLKSRIEEYDKLSLQISDLEQKYKTLSVAFNEKEKEIDGFRKNKEDHLLKIKEAVVEQVNKYKVDVDKIINEKKQLHTTINKNIQIKISTIEKSYNDKISDARVQADKNTNNIKIEFETKAQNYRKKIPILRDHIVKVTDRIKEIQAINTIIDADKKNLDSVQKELVTKKQHFESSINSLQKDADGWKSKLDNVDTSIIEFNKLMSVLSAEKEICTYWIKAFSDSGIKAILLDEIVPLMNIRARELSNATGKLKIYFDSQKETKSGKTKNEFVVSAVQTSNLTDEIDDFSAGERCLIDIITLLSLRYATEKINDTSYNIFFLDEILDSLDIPNSEVVINILRQLAKQYSVFLISHTLRDVIDCDEHLEM
jgi:DNA repair exonuclease SbcCD ATPase subunit